MNFRIKTIITLVSVIILATSCKDSAKYTPVKKSSIENKHFTTHKVLVKEIVEAGMYTYVKVEENEKDHWIAITSTKLEIGQTYYYDGGTKMINFESKELNKTFDEVTFVDALRGHEMKSPVAKSMEVIEQPEGGTPVKDILANSKTFENKEILVRGKVIKVSKNILDRNWIRLRDGTSFNDKYNLALSTQDSINVGDVITFKGKITLNKDLGHGYVYPILVEDAEVVKN